MTSSDWCRPGWLLILSLGPLACAGAAKPACNAVCDCSAAFLDEGAGFDTIQRAIDAAPEGTPVHVCAGIHRESLLATRDLFGDPAGGTVIFGVNGPVIRIAAVSLDIEDLALTGGTGDSLHVDWTENGESDGGAICCLSGPGSLRLANVDITANSASLGGGMDAEGSGQDRAQVTIVDSRIHGNLARGEDTLNPSPWGTRGRYQGGGAFLWGNFTLTSQNTDWGSGDDDNSPQDIEMRDEDDRRYRYNFDGVTDFTCSSETWTCE